MRRINQKREIKGERVKGEGSERGEERERERHFYFARELVTCSDDKYNSFSNSKINSVIKSTRSRTTKGQISCRWLTFGYMLT
jgi:hypothetical protein